MKHCILVVEDNQLNRELLCDWLETRGYEVVSASDLKEGFAAVEKAKPHAVLLDVQLGADDGLSLAAWIREQTALRHIPVIAVTAHAMVVEQERILLAGCNACVSKPIEFQLLEGQLQQWLAPAAAKRNRRPGDETTGTSVSARCSKGEDDAE
ncbi:MAG: response regulator [Candidatus Acidiferrales bacterium]